MTTRQNDTSSSDKDSAPSLPGLGFLLGRVEFDSARNAVEGALQHRPYASQSARDALNAAVDNSGVDLAGFRKPGSGNRKVCNAPIASLINPVLYEAAYGENHKLTGAILEVWKESQPSLAEAVTNHLEREGVPVLGAKREFFDAMQPVDECRAEAQRVLDEQEGVEAGADEAVLMLCYLSGRFPHERNADAGFLAKWVERLEGLPPDAPEWEGVPDFAVKAMELAEIKIHSRIAALESNLSSAVADIRERFSGELDFLEAAPPADSAGVAARLDLAPEGLRTLEELQAALAAYSEVRHLAPTMSEERQRAEERITRGEEAARLAAKWQETAAEAERQSDAEAEAPDEQPAAAEPSADLQRLEAKNAGLSAERDGLAAERARLEEETRRLREDVDARQYAYDKLLTEKEAQSDENSQLRSELRETRRLAETWRLASQQRAIEEGVEPPPVESVADAIEAARNNFPHTLEIALNSASRSNQAYRQPGEVYDALKWLGTEYHYLRTTPQGKNPEYDLRLKEACNGWSYRGKQSDTAKGMFTKEYETTVNGKTYLLDAHIGEGTRGNPQTMIRIAFAWDANLEKVIVGYIGPHQKTQAS